MTKGASTPPFDASMPDASNDFLAPYVARLLGSYRRWTGRSLVDPGASPRDQARLLFEAPFAVLAHDGTADPLFVYGNRTALELFELTWDQLLRLPSRRSAEPAHRAERQRLLDAVARYGYIDDYQGIRISRTGRRFRIERATVWNVVDEDGAPCGQAAAFAEWHPVG